MTCIFLDKDLSACPRREIGPNDAPNRTPYPPENANDPLVSGIEKKKKIHHKDLLLTEFIIKVIWLNTVSKRKTPSEVLRICMAPPRTYICPCWRSRETHAQL